MQIHRSTIRAAVLLPWSALKESDKWTDFFPPYVRHSINLSFNLNYDTHDVRFGITRLDLV